jgi:hypothetical protein
VAIGDVDRKGPEFRGAANGQALLVEEPEEVVHDHAAVSDGMA